MLDPVFSITQSDAGERFQLPAPQPSADWASYFQENARSLLPIPWEQGVNLSPSERKAIAASVQEFQLGESGEGKHLIHCARAFADRTGDQSYVTAIRRFIAEEQRHSRDLGHVLDLAGIPRIKSAWPDTVFRFLRRGAGLEVSVAVLVTAEVMAKVYYASLREATRSPVLRRLCDQILYDEQEHVRFQCERLAIVRQGRRGWAIAIGHGAQRVLFAGACAVVWWKHRYAFRAGKCGLIDFLRAAWEDLEDSIRLMDPRRYGFPVRNRRRAMRTDAVWEMTSTSAVTW